MVGIQVTKRSERASHLPHRAPYIVSYRDINKLEEESRKEEARTNIIRKWRKQAVDQPK